jgi:thiol-disulfide isomerase/thioredoxin
MMRLVSSLSLLVALALPFGVARAATVQFSSTGQFQVQAKGAVDTNARVYRSVLPPWQFIVVTFAMPKPVLITTGPASARLVDQKRVVTDPTDPTQVKFETAGPIEDLMTVRFDGPNLVLDRDGMIVTLAPSPPVLGNRTLDELLAAMPDYRRTAANYKPDAAAIAKLKAQTEPAELQVFFGSWCSHCEQMVPRLVRVLEDGKPKQLTVSFHGVPQGRTPPDPEADAAGIQALPTGIVRRDGKEIARLMDDDWEAPEKSLVAVLSGQAPAKK